jgi:hypothetical protein
MRLIPHAYEGDEGNMPTFTPLFLQGLDDFSVVRVMDWMRTNNSLASLWADRITTTYYTQGQDHTTSSQHGVAWEYAYELANELDSDLWITIPHKASDNYMDQLATLLLNNLESGRKLYVEFSNEMWNGIFDQFDYIVDNAPSHPNGYVSTALAAIGAAGTNHPKKDAYMMGRAFNRFYDIWTGNTSRLVRVGAFQTANAGATNTSLDYLFNTLNATWGTDGLPDVVAITGYTRGITAAQHAIWNADPGSVTAAAVIAFIESRQSERDDWLTDTKGYADSYGGGLPIVAYEAGQHLTTYNNGTWDYNQAVYDAQIHADMYDLYYTIFDQLTSLADCQLFMAYTYVGLREQLSGSWGHLEQLSDLNAADLKATAPKYKALVDYLPSGDIRGVTIN